MLIGGCGDGFLLPGLPMGIHKMCEKLANGRENFSYALETSRMGEWCFLALSVVKM